MAAKTPFAKEELIGLLADYDLGHYQDHKPFEQGADQTSLLVVTTKGKYAFRFYEKRSVNYVLFEIDLLQYLARYSYPCPAPLQNGQGGYLGVYHHKPFAFFTFLEGEHTKSSRRVAQPARYEEQPIEEVRVFNPNLASMLAWQNTHSFGADIAHLQAVYPTLTTFEALLAQHRLAMMPQYPQ